MTGPSSVTVAVPKIHKVHPDTLTTRLPILVSVFLALFSRLFTWNPRPFVLSCLIKRGKFHRVAGPLGSYFIGAHFKLCSGNRIIIWQNAKVLLRVLRHLPDA
ncbi:hypothetical protein BdWA1_000969 [Babesia duncani]|uniref:Uncharacterized protein n=1 Tax=Babesia duncani TaxID=323732 RepID=A0AAD9UQJ8_9APIC|nr:hypothetical protein BdWA1_000969 [Babesia duncani]